MIINNEEVVVGANVKFETINSKDPNLIQGFIIGLCDYNIASAYGDVVKYHQEVLESNPTVSITEDATLLNYMIIKDVQGVIKPYAQEWVNEGTFHILNVSNDIKITIYDIPSTETETILKLLRDNGYKALANI